MTVPIAELPRAGLSPARTLRLALVNASIVFAGAAVALQICYPLVHDSTRDRLTVAVVVTFAIAAALHAAGCIGIARGLAVVAFSVGIGFAAEVVGVHSGIPFGSYQYTDNLGPQLAGVPIIIGVAWAMMAWPAAVVARRLARTRISQVVIGAWALASWDLFLDPQMVAAGHWTWREPTPHLPGVPTVPLTNLLGWLVVSAVVSLAGQCLVGSRSVRPNGPMHALYLWTYASSILALTAFLGLRAAALWGALGMGLVAVPLAVSLVRHR